jgi:hypothetical protein
MMKIRQKREVKKRENKRTRMWILRRNEEAATKIWL